MKPLDVAIVGSGTAGPATALFLARQGHRVTLYERVAEPGPVGAGIVLQPSGMAVLAELGLLDDVAARGAPLLGLRAVNPKQRTIVGLNYRDLNPGFFGLGLHRGVLFEVLFDAVKREPNVVVKTGQEVTKREALAAHGLAVVCDGANSQLREGFKGLRRVTRYPWGALWFVADDPEQKFRGELYQVVNGTHRLLGLLPTGYGPRHTKETPKVSLFWSLRADRLEEFRRSDFAAWKAEVLSYAPTCGFVLDQIPDANALLFSGYHDVVMSHWHEGNTVFLGDCAHATSPQLGQGCNLALCDAQQLSQSLAAHDSLDAALAHYTASRRAQLGWYQFATRWLTPFFQSDLGWLGPLRDTFMPLSCRFAPARFTMLASMAGVFRGFGRKTMPVPDAVLKLGFGSVPDRLTAG